MLQQYSRSTRPGCWGEQPIIGCDRQGHFIHSNRPARWLMRRLGVPSITLLLPDDHATLAEKCMDSRKRLSAVSVAGGRCLHWIYRALPKRGIVCVYGAELSENCAQTARQMDLLTSVLESLSVGVLIVNPQLAIRFSNRCAQELLEAAWPGATGNNQLFHEMAQLCDKLQAIVLQGTGAVTLPRRASRTPIEFVVKQLNDPKRMANDQETLTLICVVDPEFACDNFAGHFQQLYDLTPGEARIAALLKRGPVLEEAAHATGLSRSTINTYLRTLCRKTGTKRMSDLLWRLNCSCAALLIGTELLSNLSDLIK